MPPTSTSTTAPDTAVPPNETFEGTWPFEAHFNDAPGFAMHYIDEGAGPETMLLLHGEPTWSYLFRTQIEAWSSFARVIAPDHMGFGKSETPANRSYWLQDHIDNLESFVASLDLHDVTLVMHDFGGPAGMGFAARRPDLIRRIISSNGPTPFGQTDLLERLHANASESPWFRWILDAEASGALESVLGNLNFNMLSTLKLNGFARNEIITDTWLRAYSAPFPTPAEAAGAIGWAKGFATGAHVFETPDRAAVRSIAAKPALALWGALDQTLHPRHFLPLFLRIFPDAPTHRLPGASHYSPEDARHDITRLVTEFMRATNGSEHLQ